MHVHINTHISIWCIGTDIFGFSSFRKHNTSKLEVTSSSNKDTLQGLWSEQEDGCGIGWGYEYFYCRFLGANQFAKAKLGNFFHALELSSMRSDTAIKASYVHTGFHKYDSKQFSTPYKFIFDYLIAPYIVRELDKSIDILLFALVANTYQSGSFIDMRGNTHNMLQEHSNTPQALSQFDANLKSMECNEACMQKQEEKGFVVADEEVRADGTTPTCIEICLDYVSNTHAPAVSSYRRLVYPSDATMRAARKWLLDAAARVIEDKDDSTLKAPTDSAIPAKGSEL